MFTQVNAQVDTFNVPPQAPINPGPDCIPIFKNGGDEGLLKFISKELIGFLPTNNRDVINERVFVELRIDTTGKVTDAKVLRGIPNCKTCSDKALQIVKAMEFIPCNKLYPNGQTFNLPIRFRYP